MSVIAFLKDIVSVPSLSGGEAGVAHRLKKEFKKLNYDEVMEIDGNICGRIGSGRTVILYDAHMDVVEAGNGWITDPFSPREENGYIYGRGVCDDKGSLAAIVYGGANVKLKDVTLYVLGSVREEVAENNGLKSFLMLSGIKPDFVVIAEPSSLRVACGNRGRMAVRIDIHGEAGHASNPEAANNAVYLSAGVIDQIKALNCRLKNDSVTVTKVETLNKNINVIPETCSIYCDYRSGIGREENEIVEKLKSLISEKDNAVGVTSYYKPWEIEKSHPLMESARKCLKEQIGKEDIVMWNFCTNGSFSAGEYGLPTIGFGPGVENEAHTANEKIEIDAVLKAVKYFSKLPEYINKR